MLKLPLRFLLSLACIGWLEFINAQTADSSFSKQRQLLLGVNVNWFGLQNGVSEAVGYAVQVGNKKINLTLRFGFPSRINSLDTDVKNEYSIKGFYFQPGLTFYIGNDKHKDGKYFQYLRLMGHFATEDHKLHIVFTDSYWGTSKEYNFSSSTTHQGLLMEWGVLFTLYKRLKMDCNFGLGVSNPRVIPFEQLPNLTNSLFLPGMGFGNGVYGGVNMGVFFEL